MKFTTAIVTVVLAIAAPALAAPQPEAWCTHVGEGCWKVKRMAEPAPEPAAAPNPVSWCTHVGEGCWKIKRTAQAIPEPGPNADAEALAFAEAVRALAAM